MCKEGQCIILRFPPSLIRGGKEVARGGAPGLEVTTYRCSIFLWERGPALQGPWMQESGKVEEGGAACRQEGWCVTYTEGHTNLGARGGHICTDVQIITIQSSCPHGGTPFLKVSSAHHIWPGMWFSVSLHFLLLVQLPDWSAAVARCCSVWDRTGLYAVNGK